MEQNISEGLTAILEGVHEDDIDKAAKSDTPTSVVRTEVFKRFLALEEVAILGSPQTAFRRKTVNRAEEDIAWCH